MNELTISVELAQAVVDYLKTRPYMEVAGMIEGLLKLEPAGKSSDKSNQKTEQK